MEIREIKKLAGDRDMRHLNLKLLSSQLHGIVGDKEELRSCKFTQQDSIRTASSHQQL